MDVRTETNARTYRFPSGETYPVSEILYSFRNVHPAIVLHRSSVPEKLDVNEKAVNQN
jgi:hypothetical protein